MVGRRKRGNIAELEKFFGTMSDKDDAELKKEIREGRRNMFKSRHIKEIKW